MIKFLKCPRPWQGQDPTEQTAQAQDKLENVVEIQRYLTASEFTSAGVENAGAGPSGLDPAENRPYILQRTEKLMEQRDQARQLPLTWSWAGVSRGHLGTSAIFCFPYV